MTNSDNTVTVLTSVHSRQDCMLTRAYLKTGPYIGLYTQKQDHLFACAHTRQDSMLASAHTQDLFTQKNSTVCWLAHTQDGTPCWPMHTYKM